MARRRSTRWPTCAATARITTAGPRRDCRNGHTRTSCPISAGKRRGRAAPAPIAAATGPLTTRWSRYPDPLSDAFTAAGLAAGHAATDDYNGAQQEGFGRWQATIRDGKRCSAAVAYLRPALARDALTVETHALATRVVLDGTRAIGVEYLKGGERVTAHADREVILAGGVINTPQLLMLSGIGDPDDLRPHGIAVTAPLKGVGRNLQDHISAGILWRRTEPGPLVAKMRLDRIAVDLGKTYFFGSGMSADLPGGVMAFLKSPLAGALPDVQFLFIAAPLEATPYLRPFTDPMPTASPAARWCCGRRAVAGSSLVQPIRASPCAFARTSWPPTGIGRPCAPDCEWFVRSRSRRRCDHSSLARSRRGQAKPRIGRLTRTYPSDRDQRPSPARHLQNGHGE